MAEVPTLLTVLMAAPHDAVPCIGLIQINHWQVDARTGRGVDAAFSDVVKHYVLIAEDRQHEYKAQKAQQILQPQISLFRQGECA